MKPEVRCFVAAGCYIYVYEPLRLSVVVPRYVPELRGLRPLSGPTRGANYIGFFMYKYMYIYTYT